MEYLSPGVYVEEVDTGPRPIEGVGTSTAGFVGLTRRGPEQPELVTSYPDFVRRYGGPLDSGLELSTPDGPAGRPGHLARAIQGFFENGGQRAFVQRVVATDADASWLDVGNGIVTRLKRKPAPGALEVHVESVLGVRPGTDIRFEVAGGAALTRTVARVDRSRNVIILAAGGPAIGGLQVATTAVVVQAPTATSFRVSARDRGAWGDDVEVFARTEYVLTTKLETSVRAELLSGTELAFEARLTNTSAHVLSTGRIHPRNGDRVEFDDGAGTVIAGTIASVTAPGGGAPPERRELTWAGDDLPAGFAGTVRIVTVARPGYDQIFVAPASVSQLSLGDELRLAGGGGPTRDIAIDAAAGAIHPSGQIRLSAALPAGSGYELGAVITLRTVAVRAGATSVRVAAATGFFPGAWIELSRSFSAGATEDERQQTEYREYRQVDEVDGNDLILSAPTDVVRGMFRRGDTVSLCMPRLLVRYSDAASGARQEEVFDRLSLSADSDRFVETILGQRSRMLAASNTAAATLGVNTADGLFEHLAHGDDGAAPPSEDAYIGTDLGPGRRTGIQALIDVDEVAICAVPGIWSPAVQGALINHCELMKDRFAVIDPPPALSVQEVQDHRNLFDTQYAAIYHPWVLVRSAGSNLAVPPSGHMLGIYANTDATRGVWKAPANVVVSGIVDVEQKLGKREQDILNPSPTNVNVIRDFRSNGRGIRVWGARCMTSDTPWNYVSVRRLFLFLEESIENGTQWAVFEPNDQRLWARLTQSVTSFLTTQWRAGALFGATREQAFFVKCDRSTMSQDDLDNGRLIMVVGVAPVRPAEFVIIRIGQWDGGSSVEEL